MLGLLYLQSFWFWFYCWFHTFLTCGELLGNLDFMRNYPPVSRHMFSTKLIRPQIVWCYRDHCPSVVSHLFREGSKTSLGFVHPGRFVSHRLIRLAADAVERRTGYQRNWLDFPSILCSSGDMRKGFSELPSFLSRSSPGWTDKWMDARRGSMGEKAGIYRLW